MRDNSNKVTVEAYSSAYIEFDNTSTVSTKIYRIIIIIASIFY